MPSQRTDMEIRNDTNGDITIKVSQVSNSDWDGDSRPDHTFHDVVIPPHSSKKARQELNSTPMGGP
ncbi:unnamed protein product, partial [Didymodactylos carnosus]